MDDLSLPNAESHPVETTKSLDTESESWYDTTTGPVWPTLPELPEFPEAPTLPDMMAGYMGGPGVGASCLGEARVTARPEFAKTDRSRKAKEAPRREKQVKGDRRVEHVAGSKRRGPTT